MTTPSTTPTSVEDMMLVTCVAKQKGDQKSRGERWRGEAETGSETKYDCMIIIRPVQRREQELELRAEAIARLKPPPVRIAVTSQLYISVMDRFDAGFSPHLTSCSSPCRLVNSMVASGEALTSQRCHNPTSPAAHPMQASTCHIGAMGREPIDRDATQGSL